MIKHDVLNRFTGAVQFTAEIDCAADALPSIKLGLAVKWAIKADAYLTRANLADAYLTRANLAVANLTGANLADANLADAYLADANLADAYLTGANLADANLADAKNSELAAAMTRVAPPEGSYVAWKKCARDVIVKLSIPADARRSNATGRKCRAEFADVLDVIGADYGISKHDRSTEYRVGQRVAAKEWDDDRWSECSGGIHHFITREEAEAY